MCNTGPLPWTETSGWELGFVWDISVSLGKAILRCGRETGKRQQPLAHWPQAPRPLACFRAKSAPAAVLPTIVLPHHSPRLPPGSEADAAYISPCPPPPWYTSDFQSPWVSSRGPGGQAEGLRDAETGSGDASGASAGASPGAASGRRRGAGLHSEGCWASTQPLTQPAQVSSSVNI